WLMVRILTADARHRIARLLLADALRHGFNLAHNSPPSRSWARRKVIANVFKKRLSRLEFISVVAGTFDGDFAFQMALHADGIAPVGRKVGRVNDRSGRARWRPRKLGCCCNVLSTRAVAPFTTDARMQKWRSGIEVFRSLHRRLHATDVAAQTAWESRQSQGNFPTVLICGSHIPATLVAIPVDRGFE